jgi:hypothetical protein
MGCCYGTNNRIHPLTDTHEESTVDNHVTNTVINTTTTDDHMILPVVMRDKYEQNEVETTTKNVFNFGSEIEKNVRKNEQYSEPILYQELASIENSSLIKRRKARKDKIEGSVSY